MNTQPTPGSHLVSFPSVSYALHKLPQAVTLDDVALHPHMYLHRSKESEAKLQRSLAVKAMKAANASANGSASPSPAQPQQPTYNAAPVNTSSSQSSSGVPTRSKPKFFTT
ncbi:hypothetical protein D9613_010473 [Agrocybe pediades]|uniref:Uncharacterized protein n=1 Tax=Agrocybe pediades TaxID=84607 RepID=A0A8H4VI70_9AGAR|nr:hypothetical protein D9613_010473 [Agrocybe pediades]KAF9559972.1 hypothetical protein CPC08DRAFT_750705 [Agrocybe pediades]